MTARAFAVLAVTAGVLAAPGSAQSARDTLAATRAARVPWRSAALQAQPAQAATNAPPAGAQLLVAPTGHDNCAMADVIGGTGTFAFNNGLATSSPEGQLTTNCAQFNQIGIPNDVWFLWTAPQNGRVEIGGCGSAGAIDTKLAVYNGPACPSAGGVALACSDDFTPYYLQARVFFTATQGQQYLIQIGVSPGPPQAAAGADTFDIKYLAASCAHDDGGSEFLIGLNPQNPGELGWIESFGAAGENTIVSDVSVVWGSSWSLGLGAVQVLAGQAATVAIWDDPNDDGVPNDLVLLASQATTIQNPNTDMYQAVALPAPVQVSGVFFLGAKTASGGALAQVAVGDENSCGVQDGRAFLVAQVQGALDLANLNGAALAPTPYATLTGGRPGDWLLRGTCTPANAGTPYCFGDGTGTPCPCSPAPVPPGQAGRGCPSNLFPGGARTIATGVPSLTADTLVLVGADMVNGSMLFFQGQTRQTGGAGAGFGDGKRCIQPSGLRLFKVKPVVGHTASYPGAADALISVAGAVPAPGMQHYQGWYRSANPSFCTAGTHNLTNGLSVTWLP